MNNRDFEPKSPSKALYELLNILDKELNEAEVATHCAFYTLIIRAKSLEKAFDRK